MSLTSINPSHLYSSSPSGMILDGERESGVTPIFAALDVAVAQRPSQLPAAPRQSQHPSAFPPRCMDGVVGRADSLLEVYRVIDRVADTNCTVLVTGESEATLGLWSSKVPAKLAVWLPCRLLIVALGGVKE